MNQKRISRLKLQTKSDSQQHTKNYKYCKMNQKQYQYQFQIQSDPSKQTILSYNNQSKITNISILLPIFDIFSL